MYTHLQNRGAVLGMIGNISGSADIMASISYLSIPDRIDRQEADAMMSADPDIFPTIPRTAPRFFVLLLFNTFKTRLNSARRRIAGAVMPRNEL